MNNNLIYYLVIISTLSLYAVPLWFTAKYMVTEYTLMDIKWIETKILMFITVLTLSHVLLSITLNVLYFFLDIT